MAGAPEKWMVKAVNSGDTLVLFQPDPKGPMPPKEKTVAMNDLDCPKVARRQKDGGAMPDDEWGWQAREFIRKKVIGRPVMFTKQASNDLGKEFGKIMYKETADGAPQDLAVALVAAGLASVRNGAKAPQLVEAEKSAITEARGKYSATAAKDGQPRHLKWDPPQPEVVDLYTKKKGQKFQCIIDHVISGHIYKVLVLPEMQLMMVNLSGIVCANERKCTKAEFGIEARCMAERFLLHREVTIMIEGKDKYDNVLCTVTAGPNVFQEELLKNGLAKVFEITMAVTSFASKLRHAESLAKEQRRNVWKDYVPPVKKEGQKESGDMLGDFTGQVVQVASGDTVIVLNPAIGAPGDKERLVKVALSSVRGGAERLSEGEQSRLAKIERAQNSILYHNLFWEGREFLRKELIGKEVKVEVDYMMNIPLSGGESESRPAVTISYDGGKIANMEVIRNGLGIVLGSRDGLCRHMDQLRELQDAARESKTGGWSGKKLQTVKVRDAAKPDAAPGQALLGTFKRAGGGAGSPKLKGVVEFVLAANRVRVQVLRDDVVVSLNMAGIAVPSLGFQGEEPDPLAAEAMEFATVHLMHRDVEVQFEAFVNGSFIGNLFVDGRSFACTLLEEGLATTEGQNQMSMTCKGEAGEMEAAAVKAKKGIWSANGALPKRVIGQMAANEKWLAKAGSQGLQATPSEPEKEATVTEIIDCGHFFFQERTKQVGTSMQKIAQVLKTAGLEGKPSPNKVEPGDIVAARFSQDKEWYRAKVIKPFGIGKANVMFIDYGNKEITPLSQLRKVDGVTESVKQCPGLAQEAFLAFTQPIAVDADFGDEAALCLKEYTSSTVIVKQEYVASGKNKYFTVKCEGIPSAQEEMLQRGFTYVRKDLESEESLKDQMKGVMEAQKKASSSRAGMWRYGDPREED